MLKFTRLALRRGPRLLLDDMSLQIHPGQKVGVTGANGTGKSSLFSLIQGEIDPDSGDLSVPRDWVMVRTSLKGTSPTSSTPRASSASCNRPLRTALLLRKGVARI